MAEIAEFQLVQIDTELLIKEVKARPSLYARDADKYGDPQFKKSLWEEVAKSIYGEMWDTADAGDRIEQVDLVQRRWKNLRACYGREIKRQKDPKFVFGVAYKRRKYLYFNELSFLKKEFEGNDNDDKDSTIDLPEKNEAENTMVTVDTNIEEIPIVEAMPKRRNDVPKIVKTPKRSIEPITYTAKPDSDSSSSNTNVDSTNFALSLVPLLNMLPTHKRIDAQIMLLTVLKRFYQDSNEPDVKVAPPRTYGKRKCETSVTTVEVKCEAESDEEYK
ncbi:uncharacterized protein LOC110371149 [Helicoverpa armigera]|uniref:uncharacterized protein LOC110371149 n=1 Tax=Helicoverpa armigera TaxID=29058 RepID=UPI003083D712